MADIGKDRLEKILCNILDWLCENFYCEMTYEEAVNAIYTDFGVTEEELKAFGFEKVDYSSEFADGIDGEVIDEQSIWQEFERAEKVGRNEIIKYFNYVLDKAGKDVKKITELALMVENKIHYFKDKFPAFAEAYGVCHQVCEDFVKANFSDKDLDYYLQKVSV